MVYNEQIDDVLRNLIKNGLIKTMFLFSSKTYSLIRKYPEKASLENTKVLWMIKDIMNFHNKYVAEIGMKYKFIHVAMKNHTFLVIPVSEERIVLMEAEKDVPLYLVLAELLEHERGENENSGFKQFF